ncbi:MAG: Rieske 2Fe-2S domain-containing protein [Candidatus Binataceae bacterium]
MNTANETEAALTYDDIAPEMGFREYWYPVCLSREITIRPHPMTIMGEPIMLVRRSGAAYALADECPHRGTPLSLGSCQFPGTRTITCAYHGWTYDLKTGKCLASLTDGPGSAVANKVSVRTYPVSECQGILWIWMGKRQPAPIEEDIPAFLRRATIIKIVRRTAYGNWRWHVENPGLGHALMLHRSSLFMRVRNYPGFAIGIEPRLTEDGDGAPWLCETCEGVGMTGDYPGLGTWPRKKPGAGLVREDMSPLLGISAKVSLRLPGITRVTHFPINGALYYEWFVQNDADHYLYFQICCGYPKTATERAYFHLKYALWGRPVGMVLFNQQDLAMVRQTEEFVKRRGHWNPPTRLYGPDRFQIAWREYAMRHARDLAKRPDSNQPRDAAKSNAERLRAAGS